MSFNYAATAATATRLLARFGTTYTLTRTDGDGDESDLPAVAVIERQERHLLGESGVEIGDWRMIFAAGERPEIDDSLEIESAQHSIVRVEPIQPGGVPVAFYAWARKS